MRQNTVHCFFKRVELPTADMDIPLESYIDMICGILDIPVHKSRVQSLHVLFTLYSEFKNHQHFKGLHEGDPQDPGGNADTLILWMDHLCMCSRPQPS